MHGTRARRSSNVVTASAAAAALLERLAFERLLAELSSRLANVAGPAVFAEIQKALQRLVEFFGYDRCTFSEFAADGSLNILCSAAAKGFEPHPTGPFNAQLTWSFDELRAGRIIALPEMPDGLPAQAVAEAEYCRRTGLRSHLSIPLRAGGRTAGVLSFAGFRRSRSWPAEVIIRLGIIGEMFIGAMRRARVEEEAQQLRARVWHADRVSRVSALSSALAHEINQPLCAILSNAQAALANLDRGEVRPEEIREILQDVVRDDKRAADTIRTIEPTFGYEGREAAVYALYDYGFRCVIAPSFGDIFAQNAAKNGLLTAVVTETDIVELAAAIPASPAQQMNVDLERQTISCANRSCAFTIDPISRNQLLNGWDDIDLTDNYRERIVAFKAKDKTARPWVMPKIS